jgi:hypothetical protein
MPQLRARTEEIAIPLQGEALSPFGCSAYEEGMHRLLIVQGIELEIRP